MLIAICMYNLEDLKMSTLWRVDEREEGRRGRTDVLYLLNSGWHVRLFHDSQNDESLPS